MKFICDWSCLGTIKKLISLFEEKKCPDFKLHDSSHFSVYIRLIIKLATHPLGQGRFRFLYCWESLRYAHVARRGATVTAKRPAPHKCGVHRPLEPRSDFIGCVHYVVTTLGRFITCNDRFLLRSVRNDRAHLYILCRSTQTHINIIFWSRLRVGHHMLV